MATAKKETTEKKTTAKTAPKAAAKKTTTKAGDKPATKGAASTAAKKPAAKATKESGPQKSKLFLQWETVSDTQNKPDQQLKAFWTEYYDVEKRAYDKLLNDKKDSLKGTVKEISDYLELDPVIFVGFVEGINTSLKKEYDKVEQMEEDTALDLKIDLEKLYFNMLKNKAEWLYTLPGWDALLSEEKRKEITREYRLSGVVINENKVGRNDPCPCGSGKKYKKCCGQAS